MTSRTQHTLLFVALILMIGFVTFERDIFGWFYDAPPGSPTKEPAPKNVNAFIRVYDEIGDLPMLLQRVVLLKPDDFGERIVVVYNYSDAPHVCLYTGISPSDAAGIGVALLDGWNYQSFPSERVKHFKCFEFVDWGRDGFVKKDYGNDRLDRFIFGEGGTDFGEKRPKLRSVSALELDASYLDELNGKYLAILHEALEVYLGMKAGRDAEGRVRTELSLSAAREAIDEL